MAECQYCELRESYHEFEDHGELDIGVIDHKGGFSGYATLDIDFNFGKYESCWSVLIEFCPFCGRKLKEE